VETKRRSFAKAISWRLLAVVITSSVAYALTGKLEFALEIGAIDTAIKLVIYFAHERLWQRIPYGKIDAPDYQI
jgi:uncharacterized membrane protein